MPLPQIDNSPHAYIIEHRHEETVAITPWYTNFPDSEEGDNNFSLLAFFLKIQSHICRLSL